MSFTLDCQTTEPAATISRSWPVPARSSAMRMKWHDLLFLNWPVEPELVQPHLPQGLELDLFDGKAWISVVPFTMSGVAPRWVPDIPWLSAFPELNVRTYVTNHDKPGVWFFTLDATNVFAVRAARALFHLNYVDAKITSVRDNNWIQYRSVRTDKNNPPAELSVDYRPVGESFFAVPGSLDDWLTSRYCLYVANRKGSLFRGEIEHAPWQLRETQAVIHTNSMLDAFQIPLNGEPARMQFAKRTDVVAWTLDKID